MSSIAVTGYYTLAVRAYCNGSSSFRKTEVHAKALGDRGSDRLCYRQDFGGGASYLAGISGAVSTPNLGCALREGSCAEEALPQHGSHAIVPMTEAKRLA